LLISRGIYTDGPQKPLISRRPISGQFSVFGSERHFLHAAPRAFPMDRRPPRKAMRSAENQVAETLVTRVQDPPEFYPAMRLLWVAMQQGKGHPAIRLASSASIRDSH